MGSGASNPKRPKDKPKRSVSSSENLKKLEKKSSQPLLHEHEELCKPTDLAKVQTLRQAFPKMDATGRRHSGSLPEKLSCAACGKFILDLKDEKEFYACRNCWSCGEVLALCVVCCEAEPKWLGGIARMPSTQAVGRVERNRTVTSLTSGGKSLEPPGLRRRSPSPISPDSDDEEIGLFSQIQTETSRREIRKKYSRRRSDPVSPTTQAGEEKELLRRGSEGCLPQQAAGRPPGKPSSRPPSAPKAPDGRPASIRLPSKPEALHPSSRPTSRQGSLQGSRPGSRQGSRQNSKTQSGQRSGSGSRQNSKALSRGPTEAEVEAALASRIQSGIWKAEIQEKKGSVRSEQRFLRFGNDGTVEGTGPFDCPLAGRHVLPKVEWRETHSWGSVYVCVKHQPWANPPLWGTFEASDGGSGQIGLEFVETS